MSNFKALYLEEKLLLCCPMPFLNPALLGWIRSISLRQLSGLTLESVGMKRADIRVFLPQKEVSCTLQVPALQGEKQFSRYSK